MSPKMTVAHCDSRQGLLTLLMLVTINCTALHVCSGQTNDIPSGWSSTDVGTVGVPGSTQFDSTTSTFTTQGSRVLNLAPRQGFQFLFQGIDEDFRLTVRVTGELQIKEARPYLVDIARSREVDSLRIATTGALGTLQDLSNAPLFEAISTGKDVWLKFAAKKGVQRISAGNLS